MTVIAVTLISGLAVLLAFAVVQWRQAEGAAREWKAKCDWWREFALANPQANSIQDFVRQALATGTGTLEDGKLTLTWLPSDWDELDRDLDADE